MRAFILPIVAALALSAGCAAATYPPNERALRDAELVARIKTALLNAPEIDATRIDVRAADGAVTLAGSVPSEQHARRAVELVRQVPGVTDVESKMSVGKKGPLLGERRVGPLLGPDAVAGDADLRQQSRHALDQ